MFTWLNENADGVQTLLALAAGAAAAMWWLMRREHNYRANLDLKLEHIDLKDGSFLYRVLVNVENVGLKKIELNRVKLFIQQVVPLEHDFKFDRAERCCEFNWPTLDSTDGALPCVQSFEPGEAGPIIFDYRIEAKPAVVSVYVLLHNKSLLFRSEDYGWNTAQIFHLTYEQNQPTLPASESVS